MASHRPDAAWGEWRPAKLFGSKGCARARDYAREHGLVVYALSISDKHKCITYVVGTWSTACDMLVRGRLTGSHRPEERRVGKE